MKNFESVRVELKKDVLDPSVCPMSLGTIRAGTRFYINFLSKQENGGRVSVAIPKFPTTVYWEDVTHPSRCLGITSVADDYDFIYCSKKEELVRIQKDTEASFCPLCGSGLNKSKRNR